jgi:hypothetical protein
MNFRTRSVTIVAVTYMKTAYTMLSYGGNWLQLENIRFCSVWLKFPVTTNTRINITSFVGS